MATQPLAHDRKSNVVLNEGAILSTAEADAPPALPIRKRPKLVGLQPPERQGSKMYLAYDRVELTPNLSPRVVNVKSRYVSPKTSTSLKNTWATNTHRERKGNATMLGTTRPALSTRSQGLCDEDEVADLMSFRSQSPPPFRLSRHASFERKSYRSTPSPVSLSSRAASSVVTQIYVPISQPSLRSASPPPLPRTFSAPVQSKSSRTSRTSLRSQPVHPESSSRSSSLRRTRAQSIPSTSSTTTASILSSPPTTAKTSLSSPYEPTSKKVLRNTAQLSDDDLYFGSDEEGNFEVDNDSLSSVAGFSSTKLEAEDESYVLDSCNQPQTAQVQSVTTKSHSSKQKRHVLRSHAPTLSKQPDTGRQTMAAPQELGYSSDDACPPPIARIRDPLGPRYNTQRSIPKTNGLKQRLLGKKAQKPENIYSNEGQQRSLPDLTSTQSSAIPQPMTRSRQISLPSEKGGCASMQQPLPSNRESPFRGKAPEQHRTRSLQQPQSTCDTSSVRHLLKDTARNQSLQLPSPAKHLPPMPILPENEKQVQSVAISPKANGNPTAISVSSPKASAERSRRNAHTRPSFLSLATASAQRTLSLRKSHSELLASKPPSRPPPPTPPLPLGISYDKAEQGHAPIETAERSLLRPTFAEGEQLLEGWVGNIGEGVGKKERKRAGWVNGRVKVELGWRLGRGIGKVKDQK
ncbi:hypothetical protein MMC25_002107 [Agyrium rufum]|nr:hypothetical protein [Agyrium rufum]